MKTKILKTDLKKIFDIACENWKPKIEEYAKRTPFEKDVEFTEKEINLMIQACTAEQLPIVSKIFGIKDITSQINNFKDALDYLGEKDEEVKIYRKLLKAGIDGRVLYQQMAVCWTRAWNEKHIFTEKDQKWRIWWNLYPFDFGDVLYFCGVSGVPLAFVFKNEKLARFAGNNKEFVELCEKFVK